MHQIDFFHLTYELFNVDINECSKFPCGQGTCHNEDGYYWCECPSGLTGTFCEDGQFIEMLYSHFINTCLFIISFFALIRYAVLIT